MIKIGILGMQSLVINVRMILIPDGLSRLVCLAAEFDHSQLVQTNGEGPTVYLLIRKF